MKKVLFVVDVKGWAYDDAARNWQRLLKNEYKIDILYLKNFHPLKITHGMNRLFREFQTYEINNQEKPRDGFLNYKHLFLDKNDKTPKPVFDHKKYDGIFFFYHRAVCDHRLINTPFPLDKVAISINNEKWVDEGIEFTYYNYLKGCKVLVGCNSFIIDKFKNIHPNVMRASQAINLSVFNIKRGSIASMRMNSDFVVGWSGNHGNKIKNFDMVKAACDEANVKLVNAKDLSRTELNKWYNKIDAVVCASKSEGGPLMLLEAGACAVPVITTPVGLAREIINDKKNGAVVDWNVNSISSAINFYKTDRNTRARYARRLHNEIKNNWTYEARIDEIRNILKELCGE